MPPTPHETLTSLCALEQYSICALNPRFALLIINLRPRSLIRSLRIINLRPITLVEAKNELMGKAGIIFTLAHTYLWGQVCEVGRQTISIIESYEEAP